MTFVWVYGLSLGGYSYTLKMFVYQKVRARNFARAWGYLRCVQALPHLLGVPLAAHINLGLGSRAGYYFSAAAVLLATLALGLVDLHKKRLRQKRRLRKMRSNRSGDLALSCGAEDAEKQLKEAKVEMKECVENVATTPGYHHLTPAGSLEDLDEDEDNDLKMPELSHFSEEGIADMDIPDDILHELEYLDNITSCDKVENYLMLSEYEQNLSKENDSDGGCLAEGQGKKTRRWSIMRQSSAHCDREGVQRRRGKTGPGRRGWRHNTHSVREITTIEEDSV